MQTLIVLIEFTPLVNILMNGNSCCCSTNATKTESAHRERRIYGSRPAGRDTANIESTDPWINVLNLLCANLCFLRFAYFRQTSEMSSVFGLYE